MMLARPALPEDAPLAAELIAATMDEFGQALFGLGERQRLLRALRELFIRKGNRFSYEYTTLAESEGQIAGLLLAFPSRRQIKAQIQLVCALPAIYGWRGALRLLLSALPAAVVHEMASEELYIAHLATDEKFRRKGVGKFLLSTAEHLARSAGLSKLSLNVAPENQPALSLYLASGFQIAELIPTPWLAHSLRLSSHYRMVKRLS